MFENLLKTVYILSPYYSLSLNNNNLLIKKKEEEIFRYPFLNIEKILVYEPSKITLPLMEYCYSQGVDLYIFSRTGKLKLKIESEYTSNVYLRENQFKQHSDSQICLHYSKEFIKGKIKNQLQLLKRYKRSHGSQLNSEKSENISNKLKQFLIKIEEVETSSSLRGIEGAASRAYFSYFPQLILSAPDDFCFTKRSRRPPKDPINALLSYVYTLLTNLTSDAIKASGLDPSFGFLHKNLLGRPSLAFDLVEELRPAIADRFILRLINTKRVNSDMFVIKEDSCIMKSELLNKFYLEWEKFMQEKVFHSVLNQKVSWSMIPYIQAQILSKEIKKDSINYKPFLCSI